MKRFVNRWYWHIVIVMLLVLAFNFFLAWIAKDEMPSIAPFSAIAVLLWMRMNEERKL